MSIHRAIVDGSRSALTQLYRYYEGSVRYGVVRALAGTGRIDDVDELVQEVWCRFLSRDRRLLGYYDPRRGVFGPFIAWVAYQQALCVLDLKRNRSPLYGLPSEGEFLVDEGSSRFASDLLQRDLIQKLLERVDVEHAVEDRVLLSEHYLRGRSLREVAEELGVTEDCVYQRNRRLKRKLARTVERLLPSATRPPVPPVPAALGRRPARTKRLGGTSLPPYRSSRD